MVKMNGFAAIDSARQLRYVADKVGKAQKCLPAFIHFWRNTQLAEVRKDGFHTWQAGHQGTLIAFLPPMSRHTWQAMPVYIHTGENSVFLVRQHPKPFNNFREIGCAPFRCFLIFTRKGTDGFFSVCAFGSYALVFVCHVFTVAL